MKKSGVQRIYMLLILIIVLGIFELELMVNYSQYWIELVGVGCLIIFVACLIVANRNSIQKEYIKAQAEQERKKVEELQDVAKAEKANYLLIKKNFAELEDKFHKQEKANLSLTNAIEVSERKIQKFLAQMMEEEKKVVRISVGRSKEYSETIMKSNEELKDRLAVMERRMADMSEKISVLQENLNQNQSNSIEETQYQKLLSTVSDSEERLKAHLNTSLQNVESQFQAAAQSFAVSPKAAEDGSSDGQPEPELPGMEEPELTEKEVAEIETKAAESADAETSESTESEVNEVLEEELDEAEVLEFAAEQGTVESAKSEESTESEAEPAEVEVKAETVVSAGTEESIASGPETTAEIGAETAVSAGTEENVASGITADPNKMMGPDDINAILASVGAGSAVETLSKLQSQPEPESKAVETAHPEPAAPSSQTGNAAAVPKPAAPSGQTGNTAAVSKSAVPSSQTGNTAAVSEPVKAVVNEEPKPKPAPEPIKKPEPKPDFSDPNKMMGPDDIAALLAGMNGGESENAKPKQSVLPKPAEPPKPLQPADPNKVMSPDEIAALIAGL